MMAFVQAVRFVVGIAMVAGGVVLAGPYVSALVVAHSQAQAALPAAAVGDQAMPVGHAEQPAMQPSHPGAAAGPGMAAPGTAHAEPPPASFTTGPDQHAGSAGPPRAGYVPPQPPSPLPPFGAQAFAGGAPVEAASLDAAYRSTLDIPPPPLLDAHAPPPLAVGWSAHDAFTTGAPGDRPAGSQQTRAPAAVPQPAPDFYAVRDGDDLTGIATRFYGHPGAAAAIWAANRDRLENPEMLPIGFQLRMPPSWTVPALQPPRGRHGAAPIEPGPASVVSAGHGTPAAAAVASPATSPPAPAGWLQATGRPVTPVGPATTGAAASPFHPVGGLHQVAASLPPAPTAALATARPGTVRVGPGDTLASLAQRFYGDPAMAGRLWEANRDRIRSPGLIVPGMELRLP